MSVGCLAVLNVFNYTQGMLNKQSIDAVEASVFSRSFRKPLYDSYCFSNIPGTVEKLLTGETEFSQLPADTITGNAYDKIVLFFVDAFGWRFFERYREKYPVLQRFVKQGIASKITSQFPSTTAAHVTTIHTGQRVDESGVFEWHYYEPKLDTIIAPLRFSYACEKEADGLQSVIDACELYPNTSIYQKLGDKGVNTYLFQSCDYTPSSYGNVVTRGLRNQNAFVDWEVALGDLSKAVMEEDGKAYFYFYFGDIDSIGHRSGPNSDEFHEKADRFFTKLEELFVNVVQGQCGSTLMLMTADHGQTDIDPATTIYLNKELPEVVEWTRTNAKGELLAVGGSCRDMFLYIKDKYVCTAMEKITTLLEGKAEVYLVDDLMKLGFFGDKPGKELKARIGNICILPYQNDSVFWWEENRYEQKFYGHHGGLTPAEMDTIFLALELA
ncbi:MAG: alkaline phosphatase family protein [Methyloligellaceae bacterium]